MAAPHVAGAAAVLFSDAPTATVAEVKAALLGSGDQIAELSGKTVTSRRLNLNAALASLVHSRKHDHDHRSTDPNPSVVGRPATVRYSVAVNAPDSGTPTGNVTVAATASTRARARSRPASARSPSPRRDRSS